MRAGAGRLGFESHDVTVDGLALLEKVLADAAAGGTVPELASIRRAVEAQRAIKDDDEIESLRRACAVADQALAELAAEGALRAGPHRAARSAASSTPGCCALGAEAPSFETIVAAGANSAIPHHRPDATGAARRRLPEARLRRDRRRLPLRHDPHPGRSGHAADWQREIYELVAASQAAGRAALAVGADVVAVDAASREVIAAAGHGDHFTHGLGHGVGPGDPRGARHRPAGRG